MQVEAEGLQELMGLDFKYGHYLAPYGLKVLDTRCYAVELPGGVVRVLPHKLLRLRRLEDKGEAPAAKSGKVLQQSVSLDLTGIARKVVEETLKIGSNDLAMLSDPNLWSDRIQESLRQVWPMNWGTGDGGGLQGEAGTPARTVFNASEQ